MKKFLLSLFFFCAVFISRSQVVLNEVYVSPNTGKHEFFELYNTDISPTPIPLDCYTLIVYFRTGNKKEERGFFVLDLPANTIASKSYYVGASASTINVQSLPSQPANFNWNNPGATGYLRKYKQNNAGSGYTEVTSTDITANYNDVFQSVQGGGDVACFLFKDGLYINGFVAGFNTGTTLPQQIADMADLTVPFASSTCGTSFTVNWKTQVTKVEYQSGGGSGGTDNGFARQYDGNCGSWVKTSNSPNHTPGKTNGSATNTSLGFLTTNEKIICGNRIDFQVMATTDQTALPVTVQLYEDNITKGVLDGQDVFVTSLPVTSISTSATYSFQSLDPNKSYIVVYKTALGCLDKVEIPATASVSLNVSSKIVCGKQISYSIKPSADAATFGYPLQAQLYEDKGTPNAYDPAGSTDPDITVGSSTPITDTTSSKTYTLTDLDPSKKYILVITSDKSCFTQTIVPTPASGNISAPPSITCGKRVNFTLSATGDAITYGFPLMVNVYGADGALLANKQINTYSNAPDYIDLPSVTNQTVSVEYKALNFDCFSKAAVVATQINTVNLGLTGSIVRSSTGPTKVNYSLNAVTPAAYSIDMTVYELQAGQDPGAIIAPSITSPTDIHTGSVALVNASSDAKIVAKPSGCLEQSITLVNTPLPVKLVSFNAKRNKEKVLLTWATAMELNNSGFDIQRKVGNGEWKTVAFVFSQANNGNSNSVLTYAYDDINTAKGLSQYRLRQVDIDTRYTLSEIRSVHGLEQASKVMVYPNPSTDGIVNVVFDEQSGSHSIIVSDISGRIVKQYQKIVDSSLQINNLQSGAYTIKIVNNSTGDISVEKVIVKKR